MSNVHPGPRGITAQEFFSQRHEGASMHEAHLETRMSYSTVHRAGHGKTITYNTAKDLETWSRKLGLPVFISAAATLGLRAEEEPVEVLHNPDAAPVKGAA